MSTVTALIDASPYGRSVVDHAAWAAGRLGATVDLLHVAPAPAAPAAPAPAKARGGALLKELTEFDASAEEALRARAEALLEDAGTRLELKGVDRPRLSLRYGALLDALQAAEAEAELLVIGKSGERAGAGDGAIGANLERVARAATRPVLVAARAFHRIRRATLAFDGGPAARRALAYLCASPLLRETGMTVLSAAEGGAAEAEAALDGAAAALRRADYAVTTRLVEGDARSALGEHVARDAPDLVVMGAYGHSRFRSLLIGSVTSQTLRSCRTAVLLFR